MTHDRMQAKAIPGEYCRFCGCSNLPLVKTPCCDVWICCDTAYLSFQGGGRCQYEHERFSLCYSHHSDKHSEPWQTCQICKKFWSQEKYQEYFDNFIPRF